MATTLETLTIRPQRCGSIESSARLVQWNAPSRLVSRTLRHCSCDMRTARPSSRTPALLTSTRIGPCSCSISSKARLTWSGSRTSQVARPSVATVHPSLRRRSATAAPMPLVPPVTTAQPPLCADMDALLPAHDARAPHEAGAEGRQRDGGAGVQAALVFGLPERERDRGRARVGDAADVDGDLRGLDLQGRGRRLDDARVGLV